MSATVGTPALTDTIVCKFGGSSLADAGQIAKVRDIVAADPRRRFVVVSAPGRLDGGEDDEEKITDHLMNVATEGAHFADRRLPICPDESRKTVIDRFSSITEGLDVDPGPILEPLEEDLSTDLEGDARIAFLASRGEHFAARVMVAYLEASGLSARLCLPEEFGLLVEGGPLGARVDDCSRQHMAELAGVEEITVIPGYYGITRSGDIAVFSRGGWTDVSGVFDADPRVLPEARAIPRLTFKEIRLLASKGFNVFHFDAMLNCRRRGVPIHIRNTNDPDAPGTRILNERVPEEGVVGIARLDDVAYIYIEKDDLSEEVGFTASLLKIFQDLGINTHHYPTDKDDIAVLVDQEDLKGNINDLRRVIDTTLAPDVMDVVYNLSILTPVGLGLKHNSRPVVDAITALSEENVAIEMFHQSPSQLCFHIGVAGSAADVASRALHKALISQR
jgi:aspartate kinase